MSDYTPTPDEAFEATLYTWIDWKGTFKNEDDARAAWDRMIAEVRRGAEEKALAGLVKYVSDRIEDYMSFATLDVLATEYVRAEAYRQERGEQ